MADLCRLVRDLSGADRVSAWVYDESRDVIRPFASSTPADSAPQGWSRIPLEDIPALRDVLFEDRPLTMEDPLGDERLPLGLAGDLELTSFRCEPLVAEGPVGLLVLEPWTTSPNPDARSVMPTLAAALSEAWARREAERQRATAELLLDLALSVVSDGSPSELLHEACRRLATHLGVHRVSIYLKDFEGGRVIPRMAAYADGHEDPDRFQMFRSAEITPRMDEALELTEPLALGPEDIDPEWQRRFDIGSALLVPFGKPTDIQGLLTLDDPGRRRFTQDQARLASAVGVHVAAIVERTDLSARRELELRTAEAARRLLETGSRAASLDEAAGILAGVARDALDTDHAVACLVDGDGYVRRGVPIGVDVSWVDHLHDLMGPLCMADVALGALLQERRPVFVEDARASDLLPAAVGEELGLRAYAALPLLSATGMLGLVLCCQTTGSRHWGQAARHIAQRLTLEGSLVIENALLREAERNRLETLSEEVDRLAELDRLREIFLATVAHELRTPLTVITGAGRVLSKRWKDLPDADRDKLLQRLDANATSLQEIVVRLLDFTRLKEGRLEVRLAPVDLGPLLEGVARRLEGVLEGHGFVLSVGPSTSVIADADLIQRVVENLLTNAARHTPQGSEIRLEAVPDEGEVVVSLADDGPGIPEEDVRHLGELFFRGGDPAAPGMGLGLALCREILELHGSSLEVESAPGRGSRFSFRLPAADRGP